MLKWMRGKRFDLKTSAILIAIAIAMWGLFTWANIVNFVPEELTQPVETR